MTPRFAPPLDLTADDRVLLHAVAMAGDAVLACDLEYLVARWPWECGMDGARVAELAEAGLLHQADHGWFVPLDVDLAVATGLPKELDPLLRGFVGEMLCRGADDLERFKLGVRRM